MALAGVPTKDKGVARRDTSEMNGGCGHGDDLAIPSSSEKLTAALQSIV